MAAPQDLLGEVPPEELMRFDWYRMGYDLFSFDDAESYRGLRAAGGAGSAFAGLEALAFIGTWCGDTHDHLPGWSRILDAIRFPAAQRRFYALDRAKGFPGGAALISRHGVARLPTFVFLREGREIGRITESPTRSLLADLCAILRA